MRSIFLGGGNMEEKSIEELRSEIIKLNEEKTKLSEQIDFYKEMESKYICLGQRQGRE